MSGGEAASIARVIVLALSVTFTSSALAQGAVSGGARAVRAAAPLHHVVPTGTVVGTSQLEPGATPQTSFYLRTGTKAILVSMPRMSFHCFDGARATLEGDLSPAEKLFPAILLSPKVLSCNRAKVRR